MIQRLLAALPDSPVFPSSPTSLMTSAAQRANRAQTIRTPSRKLPPTRSPASSIPCPLRAPGTDAPQARGEERLEVLPQLLAGPDSEDRAGQAKGLLPSNLTAHLNIQNCLLNTYEVRSRIALTEHPPPASRGPGIYTCVIVI